MKHLAVILLTVALIAAPPLGAQESSPPTPEAPSPDARFLDEITRLFREFMGQVEPQLRELEPLLEDMRKRLEAVGSYHPPEILPNGDIIIRRRPPEDESDAPDQPEGEGEETTTETPFEL